MSSRSSDSPAAQVDRELDVDLERLRPRLLLGQHAVHAELAQTRDRGSVPIGQLLPASSARAIAGELLLDASTATISRTDRPELAAGDLLDDDDGVRALGDEARVEQVAGEDTEQTVAELLVVDEHPLLGVASQASSVRRSRGRRTGHSSWRPSGTCAYWMPGLVVGVEVVRRVEQREQCVKPLP